jgi:hypothetical protein
MIAYASWDCRKQVSIEMLYCIEEKKTYLNRICFSDEGTFVCVEQSSGTTVIANEKFLAVMEDIAFHYIAH